VPFFFRFPVIQGKVFSTKVKDFFPLFLHSLPPSEGDSRDPVSPSSEMKVVETFPPETTKTLISPR